MILRNIYLLPNESEELLAEKAAQKLKVGKEKIKKLEITHRSIDARREVKILYTLRIAAENEAALIKSCRDAEEEKTDFYQPPESSRLKKRPLIVGFGPAGMFAALTLARAGAKPIVIERGDRIEKRQGKVKSFFEGKKLDTESNIQFGEGGAGTFSDGKLTTGKGDKRIYWILQQFVHFGAEKDILYDAKPHIGTDILAEIVKNIRCEIESLGGQIKFNTKLCRLIEAEGQLCGAEVESLGERYEIDCDNLIMAIGHSARDTFEMLLERGTHMEPKPFAMGVRIEHLQKDINKAQYGEAAKFLPAADYKLVCHMPEGDAYTFCMCPGGKVVAAASEEGRVVTNGMSFHARDGENANAALLVGLSPKDFPYGGALGGMYWQREIEEAAFCEGGKDYRAVAQKVGDFLKNTATESFGKVKPSYQPGVKAGDIRGVLPEKLCTVIEKALPEFEKKLKGFADADAVMTAPETRSSSPVRICRKSDFQADGLCGLYPCGEGAGYAGGIMSAAVDGIKCAEALLKKE